MTNDWIGQQQGIAPEELMIAEDDPSRSDSTDDAWILTCPCQFNPLVNQHLHRFLHLPNRRGHHAKARKRRKTHPAAASGSAEMLLSVFDEPTGGTPVPRGMGVPPMSEENCSKTKDRGPCHGGHPAS